MAVKNTKKIIQVPFDSFTLEGELNIQDKSQGLVIFAHGSGSSRHSPRNNFVAQVLQDAGLGTFLLDLLTQKEDTTYKNRFDISLLSNRLKLATEFLTQELKTRKFNIGYFGASTGAAAALEAASILNTTIKAIVSRGGRPDLASHALSKVQAPTLLIVGGNDDSVIELNKKAYELIKAEKELSVIPAATHLFEEPGALEKVAELATNWFSKYLTSL